MTKHSADNAVARCPSVRLSVCLFVYLSHAGILSKRLTYPQIFFTVGSYTILVFHTKRYGHSPTKRPYGGVQRMGGMKKNRLIFDLLYLANDTR